MSGYIKIYRQIREHWLWDEPQKLKWWIDIIMLANYKDNKMLIGKKLKVIKRGSFHTSELKLASRWGVTRKTVSSFLTLLEKDKMIVTKRTAIGTTIEVLNYNEYQDFSSDNGTTNDTANDPTNDTSEDTTDDPLPIKEKKEKKKDILSVSPEAKEIINYLNAICGKSYKPSTPKTKTLISARLKEGFTVEDFKKVIATKYQEWGNDEKMKKYLRPETLFGTKFEGYLNQAPSIPRWNTNEEPPDPF